MWNVGDIVYRVNKSEKEIAPYKVIEENRTYMPEYKLYTLESCFNGNIRKILRRKNGDKIVRTIRVINYFENVEEAYKWLCEK